MRSFIGQLTTGYRRLQAAGQSAGRNTAGLDDQLQSLLLADALIRYSGLVADETTRPFHVAVLGPTQTGKSTLVNLLLGCRAAEVSPLAGFTVHPQGFWVSPPVDHVHWLGDLFPGWQRRPPGELRRDELDAYTLTRVEPASATRSADGATPGLPALPPCVVWDTPDFDSLAASRYAAGVLEVAALADLYVLVLSKEKYSDLSVWRMLKLLEPLRRPLVICVNKLTPDSVGAIVHSLRERLAELGPAWGAVPIVPLLYNPVLVAGGWADAPALTPHLYDLSREARGSGGAVEGETGQTQRVAGVQALLRRHWDGWLAPAHAEHAALAEWKQTVEAAGARFMAVYVRDYLDHPQRYDSFRRAAIELLALLEIPKIGEVMARARRLITWPARQVIAVGQAWWRDRRTPGHKPGTVHSLGAEAAVLVDTLDALLTGLQRDILRRCSAAASGCAVWQALEHRLESEAPRLRAVLEAAIRVHDEQMTHELRAVANRLYAELQRQPARLAALRTTRATIDFGSVLLAIKTGGLTPLDALWAPATLAVTSLLMEGVAGLEMAREARELKTRQRAAVQEQFDTRTLVRELLMLGDNLDADGLLGVTPLQVHAATQALEAWEARQ